MKNTFSFMLVFSSKLKRFNYENQNQVQAFNYGAILLLLFENPQNEHQEAIHCNVTS